MSAAVAATSARAVATVGEARGSEEGAVEGASAEGGAVEGALEGASAEGGVGAGVVTASGAASGVTEGASAGSRRGIEVMRLWRYTVPVHAAIPLAIAALGQGHDVLHMVLFMAIHLGFPVVLALTYPFWEGQGAEVVGLIVLNHVVTFMVGFGLIAVMSR